MALGSVQSRTEMSTRNLPGGKGRPALKADNLTAICESIVYKMWEPRHLTALWASKACYMDSFTFIYIVYIYIYIYIYINGRYENSPAVVAATLQLFLSP
jgi:hypothetical protein